MKRQKRKKNKVWMFYQDGTGEQGTIEGPRVRLLYPNGRSKFMFLDISKMIAKSFWRGWRTPCWEDENAAPKSREEALAYMKQHDKDEGYRKAVFLGNV